MALGSIFGDFGPKLGGKLGPSWHQNRTKWGTKTMSKNLQKTRDAGIRGGPKVLAPKESLREALNTRILEYKRQAIVPYEHSPIGPVARGRIL